MLVLAHALHRHKKHAVSTVAAMPSATVRLLPPYLALHNTMITALYVGGPLDGQTRQLPDNSSRLAADGPDSYRLMGRYVEGRIVSVFVHAQWPLSREDTLRQLPRRFRQHFVPLEFPKLTE